MAFFCVFDWVGPALFRAVYSHLSNSVGLLFQYEALDVGESPARDWHWW
jgi:hypothetical protein